MIRIVYLDENDIVRTLGKNLSATGELECSTGTMTWLRCCCPGEAYATASAKGIEVRFDVEFSWLITADQPVRAIVSAQLDPIRASDGDSTSAVVLRMPAAGEDLWQMAKHFRTTIDEICRANKLDGAELPQGQMIIIPR